VSEASRFKNQLSVNLRGIVMPSLEKYYFKTLLFEKSSLKECIEDCYIMSCAIGSGQCCDCEHCIDKEIDIWPEWIKCELIDIATTKGNISTR